MMLSTSFNSRCLLSILSLDNVFNILQWHFASCLLSKFKIQATSSIDNIWLWTSDIGILFSYSNDAIIPQPLISKVSDSTTFSYTPSTTKPV